MLHGRQHSKRARSVISNPKHGALAIHQGSIFIGSEHVLTSNRLRKELVTLVFATFRAKDATRCGQSAADPSRMRLSKLWVFQMADRWRS
jgi:hypothetical protein